VSSDQNLKKVVVLGTGGTIAGTASSASDNIGYTAAQVGVAQLLASMPGLRTVLREHELISEQVAQVDSKDMRFDIWRTLAQRAAHFLGQTDVTGIVVAHGSDTLDETAFFLQAVLPPVLINAKPVVVTCAMRPASALVPDGPQNLMDATTVALTHGAHGVVAVCAGAVHTALDVQKSHTYKLDAFSSGDVGPLAYVEEGQVILLRNWPLALINKARIDIKSVAFNGLWPRVDIVMNYAGVDGAVVDALLRLSEGVTPVRGLVVAGTGNGTIHHDLEAALRRAIQAGVRVVRSTRCANGRVLPAAQSEFTHSNGLSPVKARIALMLDLMQG
jgi:L-asparaginase